jgi:Ca-activated chloride channel homolog
MSLSGKMMKPLLLVAALAVAVPNTIAQTNNPPAPPQTSTAPAVQSAPPAKQDQGLRKLSRRERKDRIKNLSEKYRQFLEDVEPIMQPSELDTFLLLETDPQRDIYITEFWRRRDVAQGTTNHSFHDQYYQRLELVKEQFRNASTDRSRIFLIHGEPAEMLDSQNCRLLVPMQIWKYLYIPGMGHDVRFVFYKPRNQSEYKLWIPYGISNSAEDLAELVSEDAIGTDIDPKRAVSYAFGPVAPNTTMTNLEQQCQYGDEILKAIYQTQLNKTDIMKVFNPPEVNEEDVRKILRSVVLADPNAPKLNADFSVQFPAKQGSRTDAEMTVLIPRSQLILKDVDGTKLYSLDVTGEILKDGALFENYRYRFDYPSDIKEEKVAVVIDRFLRPADYKARLKIVDPNSTAEAIIEKDLSVPEIQDTPEQRKQKEQAATAIAQLKDDIESNQTRLRIIPLSDDLLAGIQHIETMAYGDDIKGVEFFLDGKKVMTKRQPPYTLDLDFGNVPRTHRIRAIAINDKDQEITGDELVINSGDEPFRVRIVSPRVALNVHGPTRVEMAISVPDGKQLDRLELFLNDKKMATLFGAPWVQTIDIPKTEGVGYIRAVATLKEDQQAPVEDLVMINTPQFMEEVNVHLIELPTTVIRNGKPVNDLPETAFKVLDDGKPVKVTKFEHVENLPLSIGMAVDTSASMQPRMDQARKAGADFFTKVMRKGDRAFLVSFDTQPQLVQRWSPKLADVNAGLAKLRAEEATSLYDAIVYSLYNFMGVKGQKAMVVITDGKDTASKFSWDQAIEYARRAAVPIYTIGIGIHGTEVDVKYKLSKFASETGGEAYYIEQASDLGRIYADIQNELRSQYILGFYPPGDVKPGSKWREVSVQVSDGRARTIRGYYP